MGVAGVFFPVVQKFLRVQFFHQVVPVMDSIKLVMRDFGAVEQDGVVFV